MERGAVFIDGNNFYFRLKELTRHLNGKYSLLEFKFLQFAQWLAQPHELTETRYYIAGLKQKPGDEKSERMYADQQKLFAKLQRQGITVILGNLIRHPDGTFHEKGVDVRLAVEMIRFARENCYDHAYLLSSDTDLVAAVEEVRSIGKKVQYIGAAKGQSFGLTKAADDVRLLRPEEMKQFLPPSLL